jgi:peptide/nickel transport system ATP-binding protein
MSATPLLSLRGITKRFVQRVDLAGKIANAFGAGARETVVQAVSDVDLDVAEGEVVGLVGESGCGKSTLGRIVAGILPQTAGAMSWRDQDVASMTGEERRAWQLAVQMIFQDPYASLNPRLRVSEIVGEAPRVHGLVGRGGQADYVGEMLRQVGLDGTYASRYPHQFSGGQRQRIGIARALAVKPAFIVCDEAVAALDVSIQAQVLNLFMDLRERLGLTYLFISHNLAVINYIADRIAVMCAGRLVELAPRAELFRSPMHPYTRALMTAVPYPDPDRPLDFNAIGAGRQSNPAAWPEPFCCGAGGDPPMQKVSDGHFVRATAPPPKQTARPAAVAKALS